MEELTYIISTLEGLLIVLSQVGSKNIQISSDILIPANTMIKCDSPKAITTTASTNAIP